MNVPNGATISVEMAPEHYARFTELMKKSGISDPGQLFISGFELLEKCVKARMEGHLIGSVPGDAEPGKDGIVEILFSPEILAQEAAKSPGVSLQ